MKHSKAVLLAKPSVLKHERLAWLPECLVAVETRATEPDFEEMGVFGTIVKTKTGYNVNVTYQYALGGQQILHSKEFFVLLPNALDALYSGVRKAFSKATSRKFASLLVDGVRSEEN